MRPGDPGGPAPDLTLRRGTPGDLPTVAEVYLRAREHAAPAMPPPVHPAAEVRDHVTSWDLAEREVWVAEDPTGRLLGYAVLQHDWLDSLYVDPPAQGGGVGTALLEVVTSLRPSGLGLWVFESNLAARAFYAARGFVVVERTDGRDNEERSPDLRLAWPAPDPPAS